MKKLIYFSLLILASCNTETKTTNKENNTSTISESKLPTIYEEFSLKGKVKKVTEYHYNTVLKNGQYIKSDDNPLTIILRCNEDGTLADYDIMNYLGNDHKTSSKSTRNILNDSTWIETKYIAGKKINKHITVWRNKHAQIDSLFNFLTAEDTIGTLIKVEQTSFDAQHRKVNSTVLFTNNDPNSRFSSTIKTDYIYRGDTVITVYDDDKANMSYKFNKVITADSVGNTTQELRITVGTDYNYIIEYKYEYYQ